MADSSADWSKQISRSALGRRALTAIGSAACLLAFAPSRFAQTSKTAEASSKISSVKFSGSKRFPDDVLARTIGLAPGTVVTRSVIEAAADRLANLGWFGEVRYKFDSTTKGVDIQFTVHDALCHPVWLDNFPWFTDADIASAIRAAGMPYDGTAPESGTGLDAYREAIAGLLKSKHISGEVEGELVQAPDSDGMIERFRVTGADVAVTSLTFSDPLAQSDPALKETLNEIVGRPYSRYRLAIFVVEHVRPTYTSKGYLHMRLGEPVAEFVGDPTKPLSSEISVQLPVTPGIQYHWGGASWNGQIALTAAALDALMGFAAAEPVDELKLQARWDAIKREYEKRGYLEIKLEPAAHYDDAAAQVSYAVRVSEGVQYRMGQLVLTGLSLTAERKLLSNWKLPRGDIFDNSYYEEFVESGAQKLFQDSVVHFQKVGHLLRPSPQTKTVDVLLDFQ